MKITYITGNWAKVKVAKLFLEPLGFEIDNKKIECPELQADTFEEVAKYSSKYASDFLKCDTLKNDSGLVIPALNGFPGQYTHYVEDALGEDGILKLMQNIRHLLELFNLFCVLNIPTETLFGTRWHLLKPTDATLMWTNCGQ